MLHPHISVGMVTADNLAVVTTLSPVAGPVTSIRLWEQTNADLLSLHVDGMTREEQARTLIAIATKLRTAAVDMLDDIEVPA